MASGASRGNADKWGKDRPISSSLQSSMDCTAGRHLSDSTTPPKGKLLLWGSRALAPCLCSPVCETDVVGTRRCYCCIPKAMFSRAPEVPAAMAPGLAAPELASAKLVQVRLSELRSRQRLHRSHAMSHQLALCHSSTAVGECGLAPFLTLSLTMVFLIASICCCQVEQARSSMHKLVPK